MRKAFLFLVGFISVVQVIYAQETITISGRVTDFEGTPIDSSIVRLLSRDFKDIISTYSDENGYYKLENLEKGKYMAMYAMRLKEYPRMNAVPKEDMRLEFWAWNIIADRDLIINPRYQKLELYGTTVYQTFGGYPGLFVYFRPMSVTKVIAFPEDVFLDKQKMEEMNTDISVKPEYLKVRIFADEEELKINSVTPVEEYGGDMGITGYIVQVDAPKNKPDKPYVVFRVEAENTEFGEKGENVYFYELPQFMNAKQ